MDITVSHQTRSHIAPDESTTKLVSDIARRLQNTDRLFLPLAQTLQLLDELSQSALGRFLLHNKGLNGYWTSWIFRNETPEESLSELEHWLLNKSLYVSARERFYVFLREIQKRLRSDTTLASVPCGLMDDLLLQDYSSYRNISLVGIDADPESLAFAKSNAMNRGFSKDQVSFFQRDAWNLGFKNAFSLIVSNGLNMYVSCEKKLIELYQNFYEALEPGGVLLTSFIPPPTENSILGMAEDDFLRERAIFGDIIQVNYLNFCTEEAMRYQLKAVGFIVEDIFSNAMGMAPVVIAGKLRS